MSKPKKKRTKQYTGRDAAPTTTVHRYTAEVKSPLREWWDKHKRATKWIASIGGGAVVVMWLLFELFRLVFG
jgi:hypothetical protein